MKRMIRASLSSSMPEWLKGKLGSNRSVSWINNKLRNGLLKKYNIALDKAEFLDAPAGSNSIPIYLLQDDYGHNTVYIPHVNDDDTILISNRNRKLGAISKSTLPKYVDDVVYIDLDDPNNTFEKREKYQDPRYSYRYNEKGDYAGQYKKRKYIGHDENYNGIYEDEGWSEQGLRPSNERRSRDKSGYRVPSPEEKIAAYYSKFPERITNKVDALYNRLIDVRAKLASVDFNSPIDYHEDKFERAFRRFSEALHEYRSLLNTLDENRRLKGRDLISEDSYYIKQFADTVRSIMSDLDDVEELIQ